MARSDGPSAQRRFAPCGALPARFPRHFEPGYDDRRSESLYKELDRTENFPLEATGWRPGRSSLRGHVHKRGLWAEADSAFLQIGGLIVHSGRCSAEIQCAENLAAICVESEPAKIMAEGNQTWRNWAFEPRGSSLAP